MPVEIVWIVIAICATVVSVSKINAHRERERDEVDPKELLARRYAAGELNEAEYLTRLSILKDANELAP